MNERRTKTELRIKELYEAIQNSGNEQKETVYIELKHKDSAMDNNNLPKEETSNCLSSLDNMTNPSSLIERTTSPPMDTDPVWACRLPPPPGCLSVNLLEEVFNVEYDMKKLPPTVRTYVILKGITENEIYEFSGARVVYVDEKTHILIQARTQKSVNMAINLIMALIKEAFESLPVEEMKKEDVTEPDLKTKKSDEENNRGGTEAKPAKKPIVEEILSEHFEMEYEINDLPLSVRTHIVLKGIVENRVSPASGAKVRTEGSYVVPQNKKYSKQKPLCVFIEGTCEESITLAMKTLEKLKEEAFQLEESTIVRKVPVGLEDAPKAFDLINRLLGPDGVNLLYVEEQTGATVSLRGRRSGFIEHTTGQESEEPLHIRVEHKNEDAIENAEILTSSLVKSIQEKLTEFTMYQNQHFVYYDQTPQGASGAQPYVDPPSKIVYESVPAESGKVVYESAPVLKKDPTCFHVPLSSPTPLPTPKSSPFPTTKSSPLPTPKSSPLPTSKSSPLPTPKDSPLPTPKSSALPTPKSSALPTPKDIPLPTPKSLPLPTPKSSPLTTPKGSPLLTLKDLPLSTSKDSSLPTPKVSPLPIPKNSPLPMPKNSSLPTPKISPLTTPKDPPLPKPKDPPLPKPKDPPPLTPKHVPSPTPKNSPLSLPQEVSSPLMGPPLRPLPPRIPSSTVRPGVTTSTVPCQRLQLPHNRPLELGKELKCKTEETSSKKSVMTPSLSQIKNPVNKVQFTVITGTKKTVLPKTSSQTMTKVSSIVTSDPAPPVDTKTLHHDTESNDDSQTNSDKHMNKSDRKSGSGYSLTVQKADFGLSSTIEKETIGLSSTVQKPAIGLSPTLQEAEVGMSPQLSVKQEDSSQASSIPENSSSSDNPLDEKTKLGSKDATRFTKLSGSARKRFKRLLEVGVKPDIARIVALECPGLNDSNRSTKKLMAINYRATHGDSKSEGAAPPQSTEAGLSPQLVSVKQEDFSRCPPSSSGNSSSTDKPKNEDVNPGLTDISQLTKLAESAKERFNMLLDIGVKPNIALIATLDHTSAKHSDSSTQKSAIVKSKDYRGKAIHRKSTSSHRGNSEQRARDRRTRNRRTPDRRTLNRRTPDRRASNRKTPDRRTRDRRMQDRESLGRETRKTQLADKKQDTRQGSSYSPGKYPSANKPPRKKNEHDSKEAFRTAAKKQSSTHIPSKEKNEDRPEDAVQIADGVNSKLPHPKLGSNPAPGKRQPSDSTAEDVGDPSQSPVKGKKMRISDLKDEIGNEEHVQGVESKTVVKNQALSTESEQTTHNKANNQLSQVVEVLESALKIHVSSLPDGPEKTQLAKVQLLLKHVGPSQSDGKSTDEQRSQLLIVLQLIEKSIGRTSGGSQHQTPLLQTMQMLKKLLQTDNSPSANPDYQASSSQPNSQSANPEYQVSSSQPCESVREQKSSQLIQTAELLQKVLQTHVNNSDIRQKTHLLPVLQGVQQVVARISTVVTNEQQDQLLTIVDLLEKALQNQSIRDGPPPLQLLQVMEAFKRVLQNNCTSKSPVPAITPSTSIANPENITQQTPPLSVRVAPDQPSQLLQLLQLMITAMQTHINTIGIGAQKSQLLQITQLLEYTVTTQGKNLETEEQKTQLLMILQLFETALQSQSSSGQQSPELLQIMQLIKMKLHQAPLLMLEPHPTQLMQVLELIQKALQTYANSMEMDQPNVQLFQVIQLLQQAIASQQGVAASPEQQKQLIRFIHLVQQMLETQVFPPSTGPLPLQIVQIMRLIQQTLNTTASPQISDQSLPVVQPFSVPSSQNQLNHIAQYNRSVQNSTEINLPPQQLMQSQSVNSPASTHQYQSSYTGKLVNSLHTTPNVGQSATQFSKNQISHVMQQMQGLQNQFNPNIPSTSQPLPDQNRISALRQEVPRLLQTRPPR